MKAKKLNFAEVEKTRKDYQKVFDKQVETALITPDYEKKALNKIIHEMLVMLTEKDSNGDRYSENIYEINDYRKTLCELCKLKSSYEGSYGNNES